jgi:hypothetical protein
MSLLLDLAHAGGTSETPFAAQDPADLVDTIVDVTGAAPPAPCEYELPSEPAGADLLRVTFDGEAVPADSLDGWTYAEDGPAVIFSGSACRAIRSGGVARIEVCELPPLR